MGVVTRGDGRGGAMVERGGSAQVCDDFEECVLNCGLGHSNVGDVGLEAADSPRRGKCGQLELEGTYSKPASPVRVASLEGFSKRHSRPA
jgi:hypothetical protein